MQPSRYNSIHASSPAHAHKLKQLSLWSLTENAGLRPGPGTCRAEVSYSKTIPAKFPFGQRSFLKATFFDNEKQLLVSKSILRDDMPAVRPLVELCYAPPS